MSRLFAAMALLAVAASLPACEALRAQSDTEVPDAARTHDRGNGGGGAGGSGANGM
jgi:hypothetical protein